MFVKGRLHGGIQFRSFVTSIHVVAGNAMLAWIQSGCHGGKGRAAERRRYIASFEYQTVRR